MMQITPPAFLGSGTSVGQPYEGGHRVPFSASWPGKIMPGAESAVPVAIHDVLATIAAVVGTTISTGQAMDSANLLPLFTGASSTPVHEEFLLQGGSHNELVIQKGDWKLIIQSDNKVTKFEPIALFNLANNPLELEKQNLIHNPEQKDRVDSILKRCLEIRTSGVATVCRQD